METCYRHPDRETGVSCSSCGRPICPDCMTPTPVGMRCPECSKQKTEVRTIQNVAAGGVEVTRALIFVCVLAYVGEIASGGSLWDPRGSTVYDRGALQGLAVDLGGDYWRIVTSGFLHASLIHIGFNMYLLWLLGQMLEPALGGVRFAAVYFVSLLAGSFGALLLTDPRTATVGASGAVFGLMAAAFLELRARGMDPFQAGIGWLIVLNLGITFFVPGISIGGHLGGLAGGALATLALQAADRYRSRVLGLVACVVLALAAGAASIAAAATKTSELIG
jgi:membrane associated rhomboid family serine protease